MKHLKVQNGILFRREEEDPEWQSDAEGRVGSTYGRTRERKFILVIREKSVRDTDEIVRINHELSPKTLVTNRFSHLS